MIVTYSCPKCGGQLVMVPLKRHDGKPADTSYLCVDNEYHLGILMPGETPIQPNTRVIGRDIFWGLPL